jgi:hypothetical protein
MANSILLINNRGDYYEYIIDDNSTIMDALDRYIREVLGFEQSFMATEDFWDKRLKEAIKKAIEDTDVPMEFNDLVWLINGLCRRDRYRISKVITNYTKEFPICVSFLSRTGFRTFVNEKEEFGDIAVHYGDSLDFRVAAKKGYRLAGVVEDLDNPDSGNKIPIKPIVQKVFINDIIKQINLNVPTTRLTNDLTEGDWLITLEKDSYSDDRLNDFIDGATGESVEEAVVVDGRGYKCTISPKTKQYEPVIDIHKDGIWIYNSADKLLSEESNYFTFDKKSWTGTLEIGDGEIDGHLHVTASTIECKDQYTLTFVNEDGRAKLTGIELNADNTCSLTHWQELNLTLDMSDEYSDEYELDTVDLAVNDKDFTSDYYDSTNKQINIPHVIGNIVVTVITKEKAN